MADVNSTVRTSRRERAKATRLGILASAGQLIVERGYPQTTMDDVAAAAGVAVQTVYYTFKTKSLLLREIIELTRAGEPDQPLVPVRVWMHEAVTAESGDRALAVAVEHGVDIYTRIAPLWPALQAASANDPDIRDYFAAVVADRRAGMRQVVHHLDELGYLRPEVSPEQGSDVVTALFSPETYLAFTRDAHWPIERFKAWLWDILRSQLSGQTEQTLLAVEGLSFASWVPAAAH
jgi:TetR/AcrR family transcriptional regulator, regulator of autoinduction and epiphytic fitness